MSSIKTTHRDFPVQIEPEYQHLIQEIVEKISEVGYDSFVSSASVERGEFPKGVLSGTSMPFNMIPGNANGFCTSVLLAFANGSGRGSGGIHLICQQIETHLVYCEQTDLVVLFTDVWDKKFFQLWAPIFRARERRGTQFVAVIVSSTGCSIHGLPI